MWCSPIAAPETCLDFQGKNADEARGWIEAWRKGPKGPQQPASVAGTGKPANSADSNGTGKELKSEGAKKVRPHQRHSQSCCVAICTVTFRPMFSRSMLSALSLL